MAVAALDTEDRLFLHNAGPEFPLEWFRQSAKAGGTKTDVRTTRATDAELLEWLAPARH